MGLLDMVIVRGVSFGRSCVGLVLRPYETYRSLVERRKVGELLYVALLLTLYFSLASIVKIAAFRPFLLTKQFVVLGLGATSGVLLAILLLSLLGKFLGAIIQWKAIIVAWGYTLLPTVLWFFATSLLYVILPPPRTTSLAGILFSILFLVFSVTLLWWKLTLIYLTFRFALRFDLKRSVLFSLLAIPFVVLWSVGMYMLGIFKIPFI